MSAAVRCTLCAGEIPHHDPAVHRLWVREDRAAEVCDECARRFVAWQAEKLAKLFPTRAMKQRFPGTSR